MTIKQHGGVFGRNPTFNNVDVEGDLNVGGSFSINGEVLSGLNFEGTWDANANSPNLTTITPVTGQFWIVSTGGATDLDGITNWGVGDWALYDGSAWRRIEGGADGNFVNLDASGTVSFAGAAVSDLGSVATADINGGTIDGVTLGTNSAVTEAQIDNLNINGNAITSTDTDGNIAITPNGSGEVDISKVDIDSGTIDGTVIGGSAPAAISGTTGQFDTSLNVDGAGSIDGPMLVGTGTAEAGLHVDHDIGGIFARFKRLASQYIDIVQSSGISQIYAYGKSFQIGTGDAFSVAIRQNNVTRMTFNTSGHVEAGSDDTQTLGTATRRWSEVFAGNGTINTSDAREKTDIDSLSAAEIAVAKRLKGLVRKFRFQSAIDAKGDAARIHVGVIAQDVKSAFEAEGLDPFAYGVLCFDQWEESTDSDGVVSPAGDRYGVRYDQLFAFIISAL